MVEVSHARVISETKLYIFDLSMAVDKAQLLFLDPRDTLKGLVFCYQDLLLAIPLPVATSVDKHLLLTINVYVDGKNG